MDARKAFGQKLRYLRKERSLSQEDLGDRAGCSTRAISNLERGLSGPGFEMLEKLAEALGIPMRTFFDWPEDGERGDMLAALQEAARALSDEDLHVALQQVRALRDRPSREPRKGTES